MEQITKTKFKSLHDAGELQFIGVATKPKEDVMAAIEKVRDHIQDYVRPVSRYGDLATTRDGRQVVNIFRSGCEDFIFVETITDFSKDPDTSRNIVETETIAYLAC